MPPSIESRLSRVGVRFFRAWLFRPGNSITTQRRRLAVFALWPPRGVRVVPFQAESLRGEWLCPLQSDPAKVILYFHGGGYCLGAHTMYRDLAGRIAIATGACVLLLDYRLAPEHPYPAALDDARAAYAWLRAHMPATTQIALVGDSAGGGLALALAVALRDAATPLPRALVALSPWTDLACTGASLATRAAADPMFTPAYVRRMAHHYPATYAPDQPLISPLYADLRGLPPLLIQVGADEILLDDSVRLAGQAQRVGVAVTLEVWPAMWHVWQLAALLVPESRRAIHHIGCFLHQQLRHAHDHTT